MLAIMIFFFSSGNKLKPINKYFSLAEGKKKKQTTQCLSDLYYLVLNAALIYHGDVCRINRQCRQMRENPAFSTNLIMFRISGRGCT